jgi:hydrogenase/urease accessory protein HupE
VSQDGWSIAIAVVALGLLLQTKRKVSEPLLVAMAAAVGLVAFGGI